MVPGDPLALLEIISLRASFCSSRSGLGEPGVTCGLLPRVFQIQGCLQKGHWRVQVGDLYDLC